MRTLAIPALLLCATLCGGCLVPQPLEEEVPVDPFANAAPRIIQRTPASAVIRTQRGCERVVLSLDAIEDLDPEDDLEIRWFINYEQGRWDPVRVNSIRADSRSQDGLLFLSRDSLNVSFDQYRDPTLVVEAVVSDGFDDDPDKEPIQRAIRQRRAFAEASWTILVEGVQECIP